MSFIGEQRSIIIEEQNTAQTDFLDFLNHLDPQLTEINVREPLSGDLDFKVLKECNFTRITSMEFAKGNITSIKNIPEGITRFICEDNLLVDDIEFPLSIVEINLAGNGLKHLDWKNLANLKELNISRNQFSHLEEFPKDLEILKCENNSLKVIDLEDVINLKVLHCSNNPSVTIEHFPDTITDLEMENNPLIQIKKPEEKEESGEPDSEEKADYKECLNAYFEMKNAYRTAVYVMRKQVYNKSKSKKVAKKLMAELKPKCINCGRPVGSQFYLKDKTYFAKCGDTVHPCTLDIQIFTGNFERGISMLEKFMNDMQERKQDIICHKLDTLFNYIEERTAVNIFKTKFENFNESQTFYKELLNDYTTMHFSEERKDKMVKKMQNIAKIQERFNELITKYKQTDNTSLLKDAMTIYVGELKPEYDNLHLIRYSTNEMNKEGDVYELFQREYRLDADEFTFGDYPKVLKFRAKK